MNRTIALLILFCGWVLVEAGIPGDIDGDGTVDLIDIDILSGQWLGIPELPSADIAPATGDSQINGLDLAMISGHWLLAVPDANEMVFLAGGEFEMGNHFPSSEPNEPDELPVHTVSIDSFYMGQYEVTNEQYCAFLNAALSEHTISVVNDIVYSNTGSDPNAYYCVLYNYPYVTVPGRIDFTDGVFSVVDKGGRDMSHDPAIWIGWHGAAAYCNWLSETEGYSACYDLVTWECDFSKHGYRLPTEAEWEYAARGGQYSPYTRFGWGDTIDHDHASYFWTQQNGVSFYPYDFATSAYDPDWDDGILPITSPSGSYPQNPYGLYDMAGNVYEWCHDWYSSTYYSNSPYRNPIGPGTGTSHVLRGGSWQTFASSCRSANRHSSSGLLDRSGFRVCLDLSN